MAQGDSTGFGTRISIGTAMCRLDRENGLRALDLDSVKPCRTSWLIGASGGEFHKFAMLQLRCGCPDLFLTRKNNGSKPSGNWMLSIALLCVWGSTKTCPFARCGCRRSDCPHRQRSPVLRNASAIRWNCGDTISIGRLANGEPAGKTMLRDVHRFAPWRPKSNGFLK